MSGKGHTHKPEHLLRDFAAVCSGGPHNEVFLMFCVNAYVGTSLSEYLVIC